MAEKDKILANDLTEYYTLLNQVRSKFSISTLSTPTFSGAIKSSDYATLDTNLNNTANSIKYINKSSIGNYAQKAKVTALVDDNITALLTSWYNTCANDSVHGNFGDNGDDGDFSNKLSMDFFSHSDNGDDFCASVCHDSETRGC